VKIEIQLDGVKRSVDVVSAEGKLRFAIDGRALQANAIQISRGVYSILIDGQSLEARVESRGTLVHVNVAGREFAAEIHDTRRRRHRRSGAAEAEGQQNVLAPMPGKVVRVLAAAGDTVEANKGLLVIEAMKMQNEVRAPKSGVVERMLATEGQAVNAGDVLAVIT
jgi:biotin carboxyl carrier protein